MLHSSVPLGRYVYRNALPSHLEPRRGGICVENRCFNLFSPVGVTSTISEHGRRGFPTSPDTLHTILHSSVPLGRYVYRNALPSHLEPRRGGICVENRCFNLFSPVGVTSTISEHGRRGFPTSPDTLHTILHSSVPLGRYVYRNALPSYLEPRRGGICVENRCFNLFSPRRGDIYHKRTR